MPLRDLFYVSRELESLISIKSLYASKLIQIPTPRFIVFYNGDKKQPDTAMMKLSDAFLNQVTEPDLELKVTVLNINYGKNNELMKACEILKEYSEFVSIIRNNINKMDNIENAVESAVDECIEKNVLREFLIKQRMEVIAMSIFEYNEEEELKKLRAAEYEVGVADGIKEGREEGREEGKAEGREEGKAEGREEGKAEGIKQSIILILQDKLDVTPSLLQTIDDEMSPERLTQIIVMAAKANTGKELEEQIKNMK